MLLGAAEYEALVEELEVLRDISISERQLASGQGVSHEEVKARLLDVVRQRSSE